MKCYRRRVKIPCARSKSVLWPSPLLLLLLLPPQLLLSLPFGSGAVVVADDWPDRKSEVREDDMNSQF